MSEPVAKRVKCAVAGPHDVVEERDPEQLAGIDEPSGERAVLCARRRVARRFTAERDDRDRADEVCGLIEVAGGANADCSGRTRRPRYLQSAPEIPLLDTTYSARAGDSAETIRRRH
jgi:hypothetical protein